MHKLNNPTLHYTNVDLPKGSYSGMTGHTDTPPHPIYLSTIKQRWSNKTTVLISSLCLSVELSDYIKQHGGTRVIRRVLLANNGLGAAKEVRSVRAWSYVSFGHPSAVHFIAMATPEDLSANAEYIRLADEYVSVPGGANNLNYANVALILELAEQMAVQAVWAGWGHASENPKLPEGLAKLGIQFIGPPAGAMRSLGDKISSMIVAQTAEVPCLPWSGSGITFQPEDNNLIEEIPSELYQRACVTTVEEGIEAAKTVGFPLMIKASEGGGGKGIRSVNDPTDFAVSFDNVQREVPGSPIFLMQLASSARHLEVQLLADEYGQAISLFGRDCSVQRRHQKIIEEAPVTIVHDKEQWVAMERAAVRLAKLVGYVSTGTVEYLYDVEHCRFSFLELNPRLQVEHPCTEMVSRVNLPAAQLQVAMGIPLHRIPDIRRLYSLDDVDGDSAIDFDTAQQLPSFGHVIACRITAENPEAGFKPGGGKMSELTFRSFPDVWGYFSIPSSGNIHEYADSQFGHVFAWGKNREEARNHMVMALKEVSIRADFRTTVEYLVKLLETRNFIEETHTTAWLDGLIKEKFGQEKPCPMTVVAAGATWHAKTQLDARLAEATLLLQKGQKPPSELLDRRVNLQFLYDNTQYTLKVIQTGTDRLALEMNGTNLSARTVRIADGGLLMTMHNDQTYVLYGKDDSQGLRLSISGQTVLIEKESDPTVVRSPSPGKLVRYLVAEGAMVPSGTAIAEVEVMKMYMPLIVSDAGVISPTKQPGSSLEAGEVVARIKLLDPSAVKPTKAFVDGFTDISPALRINSRLDRRFDEHVRILEDLILDGFAIPSDMAKDLQSKFLEELTNPHLPFHKCNGLLSNMCGRLPAKLYESLYDLIQTGINGEPKTDILLKCSKELGNYLKICDSRDAASINVLLGEIGLHLKGPTAFAQQFLANLCNRFFRNVQLFDNAHTSDAILNRLREENGVNFDLSYRLFAAWESGETRQIFLANLLKKALQILPVLGGLPLPSDSSLVIAIRQLTKLSGKELSRISLGAREALMSMHLPSIEEMTAAMEAKLLTYDNNVHDAFIAELVSGLSFHLDLLPSFFLHRSPQIRQLALEIYIRRVFEAFEFLETSANGNAFTWVVAAPPPAIKDELSSPAMTPLDTYQRRAGAFAAFNSEADAHSGFDELIGKRSPADATKNVVYFSIPDTGHDDAGILARWVPFMQRHSETLNRQQIKRVTLLLVRANSTSMGYYTFREMLDWTEDCQVRHIEPAMSYLLELPRMLHHYRIKLCHADSSGQVHIYKGDAPDGPSRLFIRVLIRPMQSMKGHNTLMSLAQDARSIFEEVLDSVALVQSQQNKPLDCNHLYIHMLPTFYADPSAAADMFLALMTATEEKLLRLRVMEGEIRMQMARRRGESADRYRFFLWNETGFVNRVAIYQEVRASETEKPRLMSVRGGNELEGRLATAPHPPLSGLQVKRNRVNALETSYVYDFPAIFRRAAELVWMATGQSVPPDCSKFTELILKEDGGLEEIIREPGKNDIGMVAWRMVLKTPDCPDGRPVIIISNDIDFEIGSFGMAEDRLFAAASKLAREKGWPRIFLSANSGARIGLAEELRGLIKAQWLDPTEPTRGFEYLYLEEADYVRVKQSVKVEHVPEKGHYRITDVLSGLGVENLSGSALIASETSRAYTEAFTLTFVTGRSVGIGAYLVRLGQRVIQKQVQPVILTGVQALNQLLGRDVYASNLQIGGPQIMAANGVSHLVVKNDLEGVQAILKWLDFVPVTSKPGADLLQPIRVAIQRDDPERPVGYSPPNQPYDPRLLVTGAETEDGIWLGGLLDRGSFVECQAAWARSVVVGRGRLGGLPVAVLLVETRTTQTLIPADPASPASESLTIAQAGQVWYPDSAYKTAQFLRDANHGERLPLLILANWRGFSGGQRDLFDEILKFGSYIVDALREYVPPVFVYLPPNGQLRGGSWVVVDGAINPRKIEMYADPSARGGIIEAGGIVAIKFRGAKLRDLMTRLVPNASSLPPVEQDKLLATMQHVACTFADLHDRPGRMQQLGVIRVIVPWREARRHFYHRLRVRLWTMQIVHRAALLCQAHSPDALDEIYDDITTALYQDWLPSICIDPDSADSDVADAMDRHSERLEEKLREWCRMRVAKDVTNLLERVLSPADRTTLLHKLLAEDRTKSTSPNR